MEPTIGGPPPLNRIDRKFGRVGGRADKEVTGIAREIVHTIWNRNAFGQRAKTISVDPGGFSTPDATGIAKSANQFPFLGVDADDGPAIPKNA